MEKIWCGYSHHESDPSMIPLSEAGTEKKKCK